MKTCNKCGEIKPLEDYYKQKGCKDGIRPNCKVCQRDQNKAWKLQNPEYHKNWCASNSDYYKSEERRSKNAVSTAAWQKANPEKIRASNFAYRARKVAAEGVMPNDALAQLTAFYGPHCQNPFCMSDEKLTVDHVVPLSLGGRNDLTNAQILCHSCNSGKRNYNSHDYRMVVMS